MVMSWFKKPGGKNQRRSGRERRRADRHSTNALACDLGRVVDISQTGMKLICQRKPPIRVGQIIEAKLDSGTHRVPISGQVVWVRRKGLKEFEVGVHFVNIKQSLKAAIESIGMFGFVDFEQAAQAKQKKYGGSNSGGQTIRATATLPDYYRILELDLDATDEDIRLAFRTLARRYHPDVAQSRDASEKFVQIQQAYEVLRDDDARKSYDRRRAG